MQHRSDSPLGKDWKRPIRRAEERDMQQDSSKQGAQIRNTVITADTYIEL